MTTVNIPTFPARSLIAAQAMYDRGVSKASAKFADASATIFNSHIDGAIAAGLDRSQEGCEALRKSIVEHEDIKKAIAEGLWERATINGYAMGAMRAFFHGQPWTARAFQAEDKGGLPALPWSKKAGEKKSKPGAQHKAAASETTPKGSEAITGPNDALEARKFIRGQLNTLVAYGNKHMGKLDLTTRDVLAQLAKLAATIEKIDAADI